MSLTLKDISHQFGDVAAVVDANIDVAPGEIMCLFGPSGCGKTTLLRIAAGLEAIQAGSVLLGGKEIARPGRETPPENRAIGFVFQDFVLFPHMTVEKNIAFGIAGVKDARTIIEAQLDAMQLGKKAKRYPHELSGGEQQRVALARALVRNPQALLLDEPFAAIDATLRRRLREDLRRVLKMQNVAVVLVTHDPEEALALGDRIALMRQGRIVEIATPEALFDAPETSDGAKIFPGSQTVSGAIKNGGMETVFGEFAAPGLKDGRAAAIIRDGALGINHDSATAGFVVTDCRFTGPGWTAYLGGADDHHHYRVQTSSQLEIGARVAVSVDQTQIFIFEDQ